MNPETNETLDINREKLRLAIDSEFDPALVYDDATVRAYVNLNAYDPGEAALWREKLTREVEWQFHRRVLEFVVPEPDIEPQAPLVPRRDRPHRIELEGVATGLHRETSHRSGLAGSVELPD